MMRKKFNKIVITLLMATILVSSVSFVASATEILDDVSEDTITTYSSDIYTDSGTFSNGYWGKNVTVPSSGYYKVFYCVKGVTSTSDWYQFSLDGSSVYSGSATGTSRLTGWKYYSAGSTIRIGIHGTYGNTYAYSVMIDKQ